ncbi:pyridoxamine 5'-phosphate oxidase family protein [Aurantiacibacter odishensis]|uniref:pyridoxamine 5'-phosphate oxidase family protein n=1 Tax=Aurantiacibacter odishensis TaxID=1155476 RepID=UPI000E70D523|nr:pyridoxamine 5'-phosphate oxidase family protein [Aurantiacibacter odishensis]
MTNLIDKPTRRLFHEGEIALQRSVGMAERIERVGAKVVRDFMPDQHREFFARLPFIVAATVDDLGDVWPTIFTGQPGFVSSPSPTSLTINAKLDAADPAASGVHAHGAIGLLGIDLGTRRRNRMNGRIMSPADGLLSVEVGHAFGNCPQYIQLRDFDFARDRDQPALKPAEVATGLTDEAREIISAADTFFVASYAERVDEREVDVSHRGGKPGFVRIDDNGLLTIPDFSGNFHFNTLGNFVVNPRAGLLFIDFETGDLLQLAGIATVITDSPEIAAFEGAERLWTFRPDRLVLRRGASALRWTMRENAFSAKSLRTGSWEQATRQPRQGGLGQSGAAVDSEV